MVAGTQAPLFKTGALTGGYYQYMDPILNGANNGVLLLTEFGHGTCCDGNSGTGRLAAGQQIRDISGRNNHGSVTQYSGGILPALTAGGGLNWSGTSLGLGSSIDFPALIASTIRGTTNQYFVIWMWVLLASGVPIATSKLARFTANSSGYTAGTPDLVNMGVTPPSGTPQLTSVRWPDGTAGSADSRSIPLVTTPGAAANPYGTVALMMYVRQSDFRGTWMRTVNGNATGLAGGAGAANSLDLSGAIMRVGPGSANTTLADGSYPIVHRLGLESLDISGRTYQTIQAAEWANVTGRTGGFPFS